MGEEADSERLVKLSIRTKLFLTLLIASTLAVLGIQVFMHWSFRHGLMELAETRQQERVDAIRERLVERYRMDGGWGQLAADHRLWIATLKGYDDDPFRRGAFRDRPPGAPRHRSHRDEPEPGVWPPTRALEQARKLDGHPLPLGMRLMLLDAAGGILYGRPELLAKTMRLPLRLDGEKIGELALVPGPMIPEMGELRFKESQTTALLIVTIGMILLSAAFALPLSERLSRPLLAFRDTARRLAAGDFSARVPLPRDDELGRLGRDINALAETLERNEHARRRWMADISHELRTPVALLRAEVEALQDGVRPMDGTAVDSLHGDVLRLSRLVEDLYELSMTDLGALSYHKSETDVAEVLEEDINSYRGQLATAGLELRLDNRLTRPALLVADPQRLSQLFRNLLANSARYTDRGGVLRVALHQEVGDGGGELVLDFQDTAPGVPSTSLPLLFERLYRVDPSRSRAAGGAGLGLAICKNIVEAHGGVIRARPSPLGGLWIQIRLPIAP